MPSASPGSSFKVYDLTTAIKQGIDPDTTYYDGTSPKTLETPGGSTWTVNNAEQGGGVMPLTEATWESVNVVFAQLDLDVGPENIAKTAYEMGITSPLGVKGARDIPCKLGPHCYIPPADAIGGLSVGVTPLEQANAYATLANGGVHHDATAIDRVVFPGGKVDEPSAKEGKRVLTPEGEAYEVTKVLEGVITSGTGAGYTSIGCQSEAGKTGTSEDLSDAWFVGYTPMYLDRGLDRAPALARLHRLRRPHLRPDLALLHGGRPGRRVPRLRGSVEPAEPVGVPRGAHGLQLELLQQLLFLRLLVFVHPELRRQRRRQQRQNRAPRTPACGQKPAPSPKPKPRRQPSVPGAALPRRSPPSGGVDPGDGMHLRARSSLVQVPSERDST